MISWLAAALLVVIAAAPARAQTSTPDPNAAFLADVEKVKAHFLVSQELYAAGQAGPAGVHAAHPVHEIGERVVRPIRQAAGPEAAERARTLLKQPGRTLSSKPLASAYRDAVTQASAGLDDLGNRVVPAPTRDSVPFRARVIALVLDGFVDEYDEAIKGGKITQPIEYGDAWAFLQRATARYREIAERVTARAPATARAIEADFAALARGFPGITPPTTPLSLDEAKTLTKRLREALATL